MKRLYLADTPGYYRATNSKNQIVEVTTRTIPLGADIDGKPVPTSVDTYQRFDFSLPHTKHNIRNVGTTHTGALPATAISDQGWVAIQGEIWAGGKPDNGFSDNFLCELWRDNLPPLRLPALAPTPWEASFYSDVGNRGQRSYVSAFNRRGTAVGWCLVNYRADARPCLLSFAVRNWFFRAFGEKGWSGSLRGKTTVFAPGFHALARWRTLARSKAKLPRPYMARLMNFKRFTCPST